MVSSILSHRATESDGVFGGINCVGPHGDGNDGLRIG